MRLAVVDWAEKFHELVAPIKKPDFQKGQLQELPEDYEEDVLSDVEVSAASSTTPHGGEDDSQEANQNGDSDYEPDQDLRQVTFVAQNQPKKSRRDCKT